MDKEKRQYPRAEVSWPATIITPDGLVSCRTENLSSHGTRIRCSELPELVNNFRLVFKPAERKLILATAERVWSKSFTRKNGKSHALGVRFTFVPDHDHELIKGAVVEHT